MCFLVFWCVDFLVLLIVAVFYDEIKIYIYIYILIER